MNSDLSRIGNETGREPISCACNLCKKQCQTSPCLGTPSDIERIIDSGYGDKISLTYWGAGILMGVTKDIIPMFQAKFIPGKGCIFFQDGLCELHENGLKPTEGKLSHHTFLKEDYIPSKSLTWNVAKEWINPNNLPTFVKVAKKMKTL